MQMNRRPFLSSLVAAATLDPERLLWVPGKRVISIPAKRVIVGGLTPDWLIRDALEMLARKLDESARFRANCFKLLVRLIT